MLENTVMKLSENLHIARNFYTLTQKILRKSAACSENIHSDAWSKRYREETPETLNDPLYEANCRALSECLSAPSELPIHSSTWNTWPHNFLKHFFAFISSLLCTRASVPVSFANVTVCVWFSAFLYGFSSWELGGGGLLLPEWVA